MHILCNTQSDRGKTRHHERCGVARPSSKIQRKYYGKLFYRMTASIKGKYYRRKRAPSGIQIQDGALGAKVIGDPVPTRP